VIDALAEYIDELRADETTIGLLLHGSRAVGFEREDSDYDLIRVVSDDSYRQRKAAGALLERHGLVDGSKADVLYQSPRHLRELAERPNWYTATYISSRVLLDKTGELIELVALITGAASAAAAARVSDEYDDYLNSWVRSIKAWRRGDELGGRLHAAASVYPLLRALFGLERQWPPYHDQLETRLSELERLQGWEPGELRTQIVSLLDRGSADDQQRLQAGVEALFHSRGIEHEWGDDLEELRGWSCEAG
jgi:predicted nucleotidyltransferase